MFLENNHGQLGTGDDAEGIHMAYWVVHWEASSHSSLWILPWCLDW